jgi:pimeloyl-ACP methyl ester carboxylesterase
LRAIAVAVTATLLALTAVACSTRERLSPTTTPPGSFGVGWVAADVSTPHGDTETAIFYPALVEAGAPARRRAAPATDRGPYPLVVFVHGAGTGPETYQPMIEAFASRGYVVAAPRFPQSSSPDIIGTQLAQQLAEPQARDLSLVIDRVRSGPTEGVAVPSLLLPDELHLVGHSLGAATVLTAAYNSCCRLEGVTSVSALSAILLPTSGEFDISGVPLMMIHGVRDDVIPLATAEDIYESAASPKYLYEFSNAGHFEYVLPSSPVYPKVIVAVVAQLSGTSGGGEPDPEAMERVAETGGDAIRLLADP